MNVNVYGGTVSAPTLFCSWRIIMKDQTRQLRVESLMFILFAVLVFAHTAMGGVIESFWVAPKGGTFHNTANWDGPVPNDEVIAVFNLDSSYTVDFEDLATSNRVLVRDGDVTLELHDFTYSLLNSLHSAPSIVVGETIGSTAALTLSGGTLEAQFTDLAHAPGSFGAMNIESGTTLLNDLLLRVGASGTGWLDISNNSMVATYGTALGLEDNALGLVTISGSNALLASLTELAVGQQGIGDLFVFGGATVTSSTGVIGKQLGSVGSVRVVGEGSNWLVDGPLDIGQSGMGALLISDGGTTTTTSFATIGTLPEPKQFPDQGGIGEVTVSGPGSSWYVEGDLHVGFQFIGSLLVNNGGAVFSNNGFVNTFDDYDALGMVIVTGEDSLWDNLGELAVADLLEVYDGGTVAAEPVMIMEDGLLRGNATIGGELVNSGVIKPSTQDDDMFGHSIDTLTIDGDFQQTVDGTLEIEITYDFEENLLWDKLQVTGQAILGGTLEIPDFNQPYNKFPIEILTAASIVGEFDVFVAEPLDFNYQWSIIYNSNSVELNVFLPIPGDFNNDGVVNTDDLIFLLSNWGPCADCDDCPADISGNCSVTVTDLNTLLNNWG